MKTPLPPDPEDQNESRALHAMRALDLFADGTGLDRDDRHTQIQDLLCNLMHLCDRAEDCDFDDCLAMARIHYGDETCDDSDPEGVVLDVDSVDDSADSLTSLERYHLTAITGEDQDEDEPAPLTPAQWTANISPNYLYPLFEHMQEEHKLTLLNCEMEEIILIVEGLKKPDAEAFAAAVGVPAFVPPAGPVAADPVLTGLKWALAQMEGDSGTGITYWEQFPEYRAARIALIEREGGIGA